MNLNLSTERLHLRPFNPSDAPRVQILANDPRIAETTLNIPYPYSLDDAKSWIDRHSTFIENGEIYPFAIVIRDTNEFVGAISIRPEYRHKRGEIAYWIGQKFWNKGYMTEAAERVVQFGFETLELHKIWGMSLTFNPASGKVLTKVGMTKEGTLREHFYKDGKFLNVDMFGMSKSE
ncbi:GNAT family N-acetyltransferase [Aquisalibacillus elongatus]|uniref:RimJ/RimL family protein N-acetyltransferase n=1 Tax=Aquisalibacillus elongatus TaxID=485577 RepID=A0A3N5B045_9BACI|nr:GNAT family N-acetyltransferase [Aquisalibacillus elongatus]RPF50637.1 RimJ/RimL family protein N-acetyltransferase [Aquisalibacillus elongatus]